MNFQWIQYYSGCIISSYFPHSSSKGFLFSYILFQLMEYTQKIRVRIFPFAKKKLKIFSSKWFTDLSVSWTLSWPMWRMRPLSMKPRMPMRSSKSERPPRPRILAEATAVLQSPSSRLKLCQKDLKFTTFFLFAAETFTFSGSSELAQKEGKNRVCEYRNVRRNNV